MVENIRGDNEKGGRRIMLDIDDARTVDIGKESRTERILSPAALRIPT